MNHMGPMKLVYWVHTCLSNEWVLVWWPTLLPDNANLSSVSTRISILYGIRKLKWIEQLMFLFVSYIKRKS